MKKLTKITFTITVEEAADISKAIHFLHIGCTKATAKNPKGIGEINSENMKALDMDEHRLDRLIAFRTWLNDEIADLEAWNAEVEHFENIGKKPTTPSMTADNTSTEVSPPSQGVECDGPSAAGVVLNQNPATSNQHPVSSNQ